MCMYVCVDVCEQQVIRMYVKCPFENECDYINSQIN